ncbi:ATPase, T2SS/T4P/T4SS family [Andreprevotia chitinilytica]|uniref:ATPase, T2SS/T4P/T4SS family n=1 Tax=Andreprevotia chitinilytica TaxID=396808 RepID=UPI000556E979|nr:ATPase, T2SS/T4P/T4SS family [Andreprevotia chitinilytica]
MSGFASFFTGTPTTPDDTHGIAKEATHYRLLLVDDERNVLTSLKRVFRQESYEIDTAADGDEALALLQQQRYHVMVSDFMMPKMNGAELLKAARQVQPDTIRIMLTGHADTQAVMGAIKEGAVYKFILKPWNDDDLRVTIGLAIEQYELVQRNRKLQEENRQKTSEIAALARITGGKRSQLGIMLQKRNLISAMQLQELHRLQETRREPFIKLLLERDWVGEAQLRDLFIKELLVEEVQLAEFVVDQAVATLIPRSFCFKHLVLPLKLTGKQLLLAMADPADRSLVEEMRFVAELDVLPVYAPSSAVQKKLAEVYPGEQAMSIDELVTVVGSDDPSEGIEVVIEEDEQTSLEELLTATDEPPTIRLVNAILLEAVRLGASDIHVHPNAKNVSVRYRIDGVLIEKIKIPVQLLMALVSRLKIMAELDISERRRPQDGRITVKSPLRIVDVRISTLPTINGEKIVMRLLDRNAVVHNLDDLGFSPRHRAQMETLTEKPQGIILTTGPTGSGKTTTQYSLLQHNATPGKNYVTIEDPVEYYLDMAGQVLIKEKIGLTFPVVLRAILRQDPDVILLGEIRDFETAEVAFHAAMTGHLVYSTLHTNSALATLSRLLDLGLKPYVLAAALEGIIAQRLVRRICEHCRMPYQPDPAVLAKLGPLFCNQTLEFFKGKGCHHCHESGYKGRAGIYDVLIPNSEMRNMISGGASLMQLDEFSQRLGSSGLIVDACEKVRAGVTTVEEILRVLGPQEIT